MQDPFARQQLTESNQTALGSAAPPSAVWSAAVLCLESQGVSDRVAGLTESGINDVRLFVHTDTLVPSDCVHVPVTVVPNRLSAGATERLVVAEQWMRMPTAAAFLFAAARPTVPSIQHWIQRVWHEITDAKTPALYVDAPVNPELCVVSAELVPQYLADAEALSIVQDSDSPPHFAATLLNWAARSGTTVVELPLCADRSQPTDRTDAPIRISGVSVSLIVPTWNCADFLSPCLSSLLRQSVAAEVIVVDDASTDRTADVLAAFADRITIIRHPARRGANAARNTGLAAASGDFIAFADADNEYSPRWIEHLLRPILADSSAAVAYCGYTKQSPDGSRVENRAAPWNPDTLWHGNYIDMSSIVRRAAIPADGLHEGFRPFDDWRLWLTMARSGWQGTWVPEQLFVKHVRASGKTEQSMAQPQQRARDIADVRRAFSGLVGLDRPVGVVIPASGCEDLTVRCLTYLSDFCGLPFFVVYVDNGSPIDTLDTVAQAADDANLALRIIRNRRNCGFTHAVNQGIDASGSSDVLLLNNDCFIGPDCVENLARELQFDDRVAAVGPLTGDQGKQSLRKEEHRKRLQLPDEILDGLDDPVVTSRRISRRPRSMVEPVLSFFCALLSRDALNRCGPLDARFSSGLAADDEWCLRVQRHGRHVKLVLNAYAAHLHRSSFQRLDINRDALQRDAKTLLQEVLSADPRHHGGASKSDLA